MGFRFTVFRSVQETAGAWAAAGAACTELCPGVCAACSQEPDSKKQQPVFLMRMVLFRAQRWFQDDAYSASDVQLKMRHGLPCRSLKSSVVMSEIVALKRNQWHLAFLWSWAWFCSVFVSTSEHTSHRRNGRVSTDYQSPDEVMSTCVASLVTTPRGLLGNDWQSFLTRQQHLTWPVPSHCPLCSCLPAACCIYPLGRKVDEIKYFQSMLQTTGAQNKLKVLAKVL